MFTYDTKYIEYSGDEYIHKGTKKNSAAPNIWVFNLW